MATPNPAFPTVPNAPGVPPLFRNPSAASSPPPAFLQRDVVSVPENSATPRWGLFKDGVAVVAADSVVAMDYKQNWIIADFQMENGAFQSYDKVSTPFLAQLKFSSGGSLDNRTAFLQSLDVVGGTTELYDAVTPEKIYTNVNVEVFGFSRSNDDGVGLIIANVGLVEVRVDARAAFTQTKIPDGASPVNGGTVQTKAPTQKQSALSSVFG